MTWLSEEDLRDLAWLGRQEVPMWAGLYHPEGKSQDPDVARWCAHGLVMPVSYPHGHRSLPFDGGYVLTEAGRAILSDLHAERAKP